MQLSTEKHGPQPAEALVSEGSRLDGRQVVEGRKRNGKTGMRIVLIEQRRGFVYLRATAGSWVQVATVVVWVVVTPVAFAEVTVVVIVGIVNAVKRKEKGERKRESC